MSNTRPIKRVLIANRGEIAVRLIRACHGLGIEAAAVYSDADRTSLHVTLADTSAYIGAEPAHDSYLNIDNILTAAREMDVDALHPGYGFLSENPEFAERCTEAGITFIGPTANAMRALADKAQAKQVAKASDVPTVPEWEPHEVPSDAYPVLVKASAGGGGRGMRRVDRHEDLPVALESAAREAEAGFGDSTLIVEKLIENARHVEIQVLADEHGNYVYVGDRDCSLQRRHQKVVEESPAPLLGSQLRVSMGEAALRLAKHAGYSNAGTAEFLVDRSGRYYFLELNARLQVEHPVTEQAFGVDLAQWQIRIARGETLSVTQDSIQSRAHSIEARVYAEDPVTFLPTGGEILKLHIPSGEGIRIDHALTEGSKVSLAYDPLLAKVIATGATRDLARSVLLDALERLSILGVLSNVALLRHALSLSSFVDATHTTSTLEASPLPADALTPSPAIVDAARRRLVRAAGEDPTRNKKDPFREVTKTCSVTADCASYEHLENVPTSVRGDQLWFSHLGSSFAVSRNPLAESISEKNSNVDGDHASLVAPMPGTVIKAAEPGTDVSVGDAVVVIEAMKMESSLASPFDGRVLSVGCRVGDLVSKGAVLAEVAR